MTKIDYQIIQTTDEDYPSSLLNLPQPPKTLYKMGVSLNTLLDGPCLSVVGSRKCTPYGKTITDELVRTVAKNGVTIISGLALGIDSIAHRATLDVGGRTVAVLPSSVEEIYPGSHHQLAQHIIRNGGAVLSEYPKGTPALKHNFIARNRIIAGLADAVLVTEAAEKSGSLHTVNFALEQGKTVLAVPGDITKPSSVGTNNLIKSGAIVVTSAKDILDVMNISSLQQSLFKPQANSVEELIIIELLDNPKNGQELLEQSALSADVFNQTLTMLEISGKIKPLGNDFWVLG